MTHDEFMEEIEYQVDLEVDVDRGAKIPEACRPSIIEVHPVPGVKRLKGKGKVRMNRGKAEAISLEGSVVRIHCKLGSAHTYQIIDGLGEVIKSKKGHDGRSMTNQTGKKGHGTHEDGNNLNCTQDNLIQKRFEGWKDL